MKDTTLRNRIVRYVLLSGILTLLVFTIALYISQRSRTIRETQHKALLAAENVGTKIQGGFYKYAAYDEVIIFDEVIRQFARTQTDRTIASVHQNPYIYSTLDLFNKLSEISPEIEDVFLGLENTGNYVSVKYTVYDDQEYDCRERSWYINAAKEDKFVPGTMVYDAGDSSTSLTGLMPMREEDGTLLGIAGIDIDINFAQNLIQNIKFGEKGRGFLVMQDKQIFHFPILDFKIGRYLHHIDKDLPDASGFTALDTLIWQQKNGTHEVIIDGEEYQIFFSTMELLNWKMGILVPTSEIVAPANAILKQSFFYLIFGILLMLGAAYFIANPIIKPMEDLAERFNDLAGMEADLTHEIEVKSSDEIGQVSSGFNRFLNIIRKMVSVMKAKTQQIGVSIQQLVMTTGEMNSNAEKIATQTNEIATATKELAQSIDQINQNTGEMAKAIAGSEETIASSSGDMEKFISGADSLVHGVKNISESLEGLGEFSEKIEGTISFIDGIADRVSLLALNASIEAATAGTHGQGFQVVANEIKNLSNKIFDQTKEIKSNLESLALVIGNVKSELDSLSNVANKEIAYSQKAKRAIVAMEVAISETNTSIKEISSEAQEQSNSTQLISSSIEEIAANNEKFLDSIMESNDNVEEINQMVVKLQDLVAKLKS